MSIARILKSPWTTHIGLGAITFGGGVGLGYWLWGREPQYEVVVPAEEDPQLEFDFDTEGLAEAHKVIAMESYGNPILAPETDAEVVNDTLIVRPDPVEEPVQLVEVNVFEQQDPDWDWEKEIESRDETKPYILHEDEYYQNEREYTQSVLTYYAGDDIMVDEKDVPIHGYESLTGPLTFGHGTRDPSSVLIRNNERKAEFEITFDPGRYEVEVLGLHYEEQEAEQDLKHSRVSRFRMD